jgi:alanyl-tRNA synthetase
VFFKDECVEFNLRWLTEELEIDPDEITLIEDVWAGGGNLGPSIEYFINGLELGNMVFMQYKTFPDGVFFKPSVSLLVAVEVTLAA